MEGNFLENPNQNQQQENTSHSSESNDFMNTVSTVGTTTAELRSEPTSDSEDNLNSSESTGTTTASLRNRSIASTEIEENIDNFQSPQPSLNSLVVGSSLVTVQNNLNNSVLSSNSETSNDFQYSREQDRFYENNFYDINIDSSDEDSDFEEAINEDENIYIPRFKRLSEMLEKDDFNESLSVDIVVSKIEILLSILKFSNTYSLPNSAIADLCKMINSFVEVPIIPDTRYMVDKLFFPGEDVEYHALCPNCKNYIKEFHRDDREVYCNICEINICLKDPGYNDFFVVLDIKHELQHLVENNQEYYMEVMNNRDAVNTFKDIYDGRKYKEFVASLPDEQKRSYLSFNFNSDGSPLFKSSKFSIWPLQVYPNEIPPSVRNKRPITFALWFGHNKPNMNIFLTPFIKSMNELAENGINCNINNEIKNIRVYAICCCVDSAARGPMQGLIQFNGYYGCSWCLHPGELVVHNTGSVVKYTLMNEVPPERTEENAFTHIQEAINSETNVYGFKKATPLLLLNKFNIIDGFVPDVMHCIDLGIAKQFSNYWFEMSYKPYSILKIDRERIDKYIKGFKVPSQIARLSRSIIDRKFWKSREWENWILYYSLPVLKEVQGFEPFLKHWELLVESLHLLMKDSITHEELLRSDGLCKQFVAETEYYYSKDAMTYNVHQIQHICQSVANWGPLWAHSGYAFESGNGQIIRNVHAAKGVISQICRNLSVNESLKILEKHIATKEYSPTQDYCYYLENRCTKKSLKVGINRYFGKQCLLDEEEINDLNLSRTFQFRTYEKMIKNKCVFKSCNKVLQRSNNSFALTTNGDYIQIIKFLVDNLNVVEYTLCKKIEVENFDSICKSIKKISRVQDNITVIETSSIFKLCVFMTVNQKRYISAVPNMYWYS